MNLATYEPKPHPTKKIFKDNGVKFSTVARGLGYTYNYTVNILNGVVKPSPQAESKLRELADSLEVDRVEAGRD